MVIVVPLLSFDGTLPAAATGIDPAGIAAVVLGGLLCVAGALLFAVRSRTP